MGFRLVLFALLFASTPVFAERTLTISKPVRSVSLLGGTSILVDSSLILIGETIQIIRCKLGGFKSGDRLAVTTKNSAISGDDSSLFSQVYDSTTGILTITDPYPILARGSSGAAWETLLRTLSFYPATVSMSQNTRRTVEYEVLELGKWFVIGDTYHFYDFISSSGITWTAAKAAASSQKWYGKTGYLGTITSSEEFTHMSNQAPGNSGWLAGSDSMSGSLGASDGGTYSAGAATDTLSEGYWKWDAGPEQGQLFWIGNDHRAGSHSNKTGTTPVGRYSNWPSSQPDNAGEEDALQITTAGTFNDLPVGHTEVAGYFVEWGGMPEPAATVTIKIQNHNAIKHAAGF